MWRATGGTDCAEQSPTCPRRRPASASNRLRTHSLRRRRRTVPLNTVQVSPLCLTWAVLVIGPRKWKSRSIPLKAKRLQASLHGRRKCYRVCSHIFCKQYLRPAQEKNTLMQAKLLLRVAFRFVAKVAQFNASVLCQRRVAGRRDPCGGNETITLAERG